MTTVPPPREIPTFHIADYVVFGVFLLLTSLVGVYFGLQGRKAKQSAKDFLTGGGNLHWGPVTLSLMASFTSAIFVFGFPAEIYLYGIPFLYFGFGYIFSYVITAFFYIPVYHRLGLTSAYEYLERRFNKALRLMGSLTCMLMISLYLPVVLYTPALAISQVADMPQYIAILSVGGVCTFYTAMGGMKATVWNDAIQMSVTVVGIVILIGMGIAEVGGISDVYNIAEEGGRLDFKRFSLDPTTRVTFWSHTIGGTLTNLALGAGIQTQIQKFLTTATIKDGQKAALAGGFATAGLLILVSIKALVMYAYYECDPLVNGDVDAGDQLVPLFMLEIMGDLHGLPGFFLSAVCSTSLSSVSGGLNALAAIFYTDIMRPYYYNKHGKEMNTNVAKLITRCTAIGFGVLVSGMAFLADAMGQSVVTAALSVFGMVGAPLFMTMTMGIYMPFINSWGAGVSLVVSLAVNLWVGIGTIAAEIPRATLPLRAECDSGVTAAPPPDQEDIDDYLWIYRIDNFWYTLQAVIVSLIVAIPVTLITGKNKRSDIEPELLFTLREAVTCNYGEKDKDDDRHSIISTSQIIEITVNGKDNEAYDDNLTDEQKIRAHSKTSEDLRERKTADSEPADKNDSQLTAKF